MKKKGMVLGKFLPPHKGHMYLIDFAKNFVDELTVVVGTLKAEPIPGKIRYRWIKELYPDVNIVHLEDENPQYPEENPDFWNIWKRSLLNVLPYEVDYVFASEAYGARLADVLNAQFVPCDEKRSLFPISGTDIRKNVYQNWDYIPQNVRQFFTKKVCVFGPESTGKSTLTKDLAKHYQTNFVPEYARTFFDTVKRDFRYEDMDDVGRGQMASMNSLLGLANKIIFSDTDLLTSKIWSEWLFDKSSEFLNSTSQEFDLYLLLDTDVPWVDDGIRYFPEKRQEFFNDCRNILEMKNLPFVIISGDWDQRFRSAITAVDLLFNKEGWG